LLALASDHAIISYIIANDSAYSISSPLEPETGRALKVVGCMALVVWGRIGTLGISFGERGSAVASMELV
jgi:hypothetical protein